MVYKGYWCLVLHAHLPFVRHPEYPAFLEEDWFYEGVVETYIPLLHIFERLAEENIHFRVTLSLSPTLCAMLTDELLQKRCYRYISQRVDLAEKELYRTRYMPEFHETAKMYKEKISIVMKIYDKYQRNILTGYKNLQDNGNLEIITCCSTHSLLPLEICYPAVHSQVKIAVDDYTEKFDRAPRGIWLSECAFQPGLEHELKQNNLRYFFVEAHGILYGTPRPRYGVFAPVYCPNGVAVFGRDIETAHQVWSADVGYPGDFVYREFYRDIGYDLDYNYIRPYLHSDGIRRNVGFKYYCITGKVPLSDKKPYNPTQALNKAAEHAGNFMFNREQQISYLYDFLGREPIIVSPYDAELFGHWWYEGPAFLDFLFRKIYYDQKTFTTITPSEYLEMYPKNQILTPAASSWGDKGYFEVWLNGTNDWLYRHLHKAAERMVELADTYPSSDGLMRRVLNQASRELLLAQASDWPFIMTCQTMVEYAQKRFQRHIINFTNLYHQIKQNQINETYLKDLEWKNNIFPKIDYRVFLSQQ